MATPVPAATSPAAPPERDFTARFERVAFVVMTLAFLALPYLIYPRFAMQLLCFALFACAFNLLIGFGGLLSFGHAMFFGMGSYLAAHAALVWKLPVELAILTGAGTALGLGVVVIGKIALGRSFGLVPANRGVVVRGPYTVVRHPIYTGYLITHIGFLMAQPTPWNAGVFVVADVALVLRALMEERILSADVDYQQYCRKVGWHLVPGVF